jgi:hypothetical protein
MNVTVGVDASGGLILSPILWRRRVLDRARIPIYSIMVFRRRSRLDDRSWSVIWSGGRVVEPNVIVLVIRVFTQHELTCSQKLTVQWKS